MGVKFVKMKFLTRKKNVLFIGCTGLLGSKFVDECAKKYNIIGVSRHTPIDKIDVHHITADIITDTEKIIAEATSYGQIDAVVHNAVHKDLGLLLDKNSDEYEREIQTGLIGPLELNRQLIKYWSNDAKQSTVQKTIVHIGSIAGFTAYFNHGLATYASVKAALGMLFCHMAEEYGNFDVAVNLVSPGPLQQPEILNATVAAIASCLDNQESNGNILHIEGTVEGVAIRRENVLILAPL